MSNDNANDDSTTFITMSVKKLLLVALAGAVAGIATWGLTFVFNTYVYQAILCNGEASAQCATSPQYALTTASLIGAAIALFALVRLQVYRPLLVVILAFASLWGTVMIVSDLVWFVAAIASAFLYGVGLAAFAWIARIRQFFLALIVMIVMLVLVRLILNT